MNIGLTYFWKSFSWIGVEIVCMLISQLLLLYMWESFTHTHILLMCSIHWQCENIFERLMKIYDSLLDFEKWWNIFSYCLNVWMFESLVNKSTWWKYVEHMLRGSFSLFNYAFYTICLLNISLTISCALCLFLDKKGEKLYTSPCLIWGNSCLT